MNNILIIGCGLLGSSLLRRIHKKKIAKKIFPIWLYVTLTGVFVYVFLRDYYNCI